MRRVCIFICAVCCMLASCTATLPSADGESGTEDMRIDSVESLTEVVSSEVLDLAALRTVSEFVSYMYQTAVTAEKSIGDLEETLAPGDVLPPECLPSVAAGVEGQTVSLSLKSSENDVFLRMYSTETGMTVAIVTANGNGSTCFQPILLMLDVPYSTGTELFDHLTSVQGTVRSVCFLDGNEYSFVLNSFDALSETVPNGSVTTGDAHGVIRVDGTAYTSFGNGSSAAETVDRVYERILSRFEVTIPS